MRLDGFGLLVEDMAKMIRFYRDVLGFEIKETEDTSNVYGVLKLSIPKNEAEKLPEKQYIAIEG